MIPEIEAFRIVLYENAVELMNLPVGWGHIVYPLPNANNLEFTEYLHRMCSLIAKRDFGLNVGVVVIPNGIVFYEKKRKV